MTRYVIRGNAPDAPVEVFLREDRTGGIEICVGDYYVATLTEEGELELADLSMTDGFARVKLDSKGYIKTTKEQ